MFLSQARRKKEKKKLEKENQRRTAPHYNNFLSLKEAEEQEQEQEEEEDITFASVTSPKARKASSRDLSVVPQDNPPTKTRNSSPVDIMVSLSQRGENSKASKKKFLLALCCRCRPPPSPPRLLLLRKRPSLRFLLRGNEWERQTLKGREQWTASKARS
jgi:hypothetical protein